MSSNESLEHSESIRNEALGWLPYNCVKAQLPVLIEYAVENPPGTLKVEYSPADVLFVKETLSIRYIEPILVSTPENTLSELEINDGTRNLHSLNPKTIGDFALQIWIELDPGTSAVDLFSRIIGKNRDGFVDDIADRLELKIFNNTEEKLLAELTGGIDKNAPGYEKDFLRDSRTFNRDREDEILQVFKRISGHLYDA